MNKKLVDALLMAETIGGVTLIGLHAAREYEVIKENDDDKPEWYEILDWLGYLEDNMLKGAVFGGLVTLQKVALYAKYGYELPVK